MWRDTALIVTTDHGFLLGEHDFWAKNRMNMYEEIVHIPLIVHDPRQPAAVRVDKLTQSVDVAPTILDLFGAAPPAECQGRSLLREGDREAVIFGYFGGAVNVTDGRDELPPLPRRCAGSGDLPVHADAHTHHGALHA